MRKLGEDSNFLYLQQGRMARWSGTVSELPVKQLVPMLMLENGYSYGYGFAAPR